MNKIDLYNSQAVYERWIKKVRSDGIEQVNQVNTEILITHLEDMAAGINVAVTVSKGSRSYNRLMTIGNRMMCFLRFMEQKYGSEKDVTTLTSSEVLRLFAAVRSGELKGRSGKQLKDVQTIAKVFSAFWRWHIKNQREQGIEVKDITLDLRKGNDSKPPWVYFEHHEMERLKNAAQPFYRTLIWFGYDVGARATELLNVRCVDLFEENGHMFVRIRPESAKTFGRTVQLLLSADLVKEHLAREKLSGEDVLFNKSPAAINMYLKRLAEGLYGSRVTLARELTSKLTIYDIRHNSVCMRIRLKQYSVADLMAIFGWKKPDKIFYYSELLGSTTTINQNEIAAALTGRSFEKQLEDERTRVAALEEKVGLMDRRFQDFAERIELLIVNGLLSPNFNRNDLCSGRDIEVSVKTQGRSPPNTQEEPKDQIATKEGQDHETYKTD